MTRFTEWVNAPVQGTGADGLKLALAFLWERRGECSGAMPVACVHDEIAVECDEDEAEKAKVWLEKAMIDGMDEVLNRPGAEGPVCRSKSRRISPRPGRGSSRSQ